MKYKQWLILIIQYFIFVYVNVDSLAPASLTSLSACPIRCGYTCSQMIQSAQQASRQYMKVCLTEIHTHRHTYTHVECKRWVMWVNQWIVWSFCVCIFHICLKLVIMATVKTKNNIKCLSKVLEQYVRLKQLHYALASFCWRREHHSFKWYSILSIRRDHLEEYKHDLLRKRN